MTKLKQKITQSQLRIHCNLLCFPRNHSIKGDINFYSALGGQNSNLVLPFKITSIRACSLSLVPVRLDGQVNVT